MTFSVTTWASDEDVRRLTGVRLLDYPTEYLPQAQGVVELFAGITAGNTTELSTGNARMLCLAVAYQAAWMATQVDVTTRMDVAALSQDGASVTPAGPDDLVLAPLAKRALARVSWLRGTGLRVRVGRTRFSASGDYAEAWLRDETSDSWIPSGGSYAPASGGRY